MSAIEAVNGQKFIATIEAALAGGERFAAAWASGRGDESAWRVLLVSPRRARVVSVAAADGPLESITGLIEAADWDEREAHDLHGLDFSGHSPLRPLLEHTDDAERWMTPVSGDGVHQVAVGPIHAGVIESGHFRFHVVGERILAMDPRLFYKHRGLERACEGQDVEDGLRYAGRACAACAVANTLAYAQAVESAYALEPDHELRAARTVLLELERLYNHLHDIGAICAGVGFAPGTMAFAALKDRAQQINAADIRAPLPLQHHRDRPQPAHARAGRPRRDAVRPARAAHRHRGGVARRAVRRLAAGPPRRRRRARR